MAGKITVALDADAVADWEGTYLGKTERLLFRLLWEALISGDMEKAGKVISFLGCLRII